MAEWRKLALLCSLLSLPGILLLIFTVLSCPIKSFLYRMFSSVIQESPYYLLQKGRYKEAIDVLTTISSWNSESIPRREIAEIVALEASKKHREKTATFIKRYTYLDLYHSPRLALYTITTSFGFITANCVTYSLLFNLSIVDGSLYVNTALSGALRYVIGISIALIDYLCVNAGRKTVHAGSMAFIVACLSGIVLILNYEVGDKYAYLIRMFTLIAFGITGSIFTQLWLITAELFPTVVRNLANAHGNVLSRMGSAMAPSIFELATISPEAPYLLLTCISTIDIIAIWFGIPETKNKHLIDDFISER
ncbi:unnamed protein product [Toxocara canis]|uniref:MFS domain-containing protein n=1 Tax=Toxocara canis TaxID=6265 RepID=A0A183UG23_TOXCA|nr:unnamed protein product [Toxocara canis]